MGYARNPFWQWENDVSSATVGVILAIIVVATAILLTLLLILLKELWRIYQDRAQGDPDSPTARVLWFALAAFLGALLLGAVLAVLTGAVSIALLLAAWSFLIFVVVVELADHWTPTTAIPGGEGLVLGETIH